MPEPSRHPAPPSPPFRVGRLEASLVARIRSRSTISRFAALSTLMVLLCSAVPIAWLLLQVLRNPVTLRLLHPDLIRWDILRRTCFYNLGAAALATLFGWPVGLAIGARRGWVSRAAALALPTTLLLPSLMYAYGWAQFVRRISPAAGEWASAVGLPKSVLAACGLTLKRIPGEGFTRLTLDLAGPADVLRCVFSIAAWLWPIPAAAIAWSLLRADPSVRQQAVLDGAAGRLTRRLSVAPGLVGGLVVFILASQEFAVYEPTGISVVATEVRMVFETGSFSSPTNPITAPMGGAAGGAMANAGGTNEGSSAAPVVTTVAGPVAAPPAAPIDPALDEPDVQQRAASAAVATAAPMLAIAALLGALVVFACRRWSASGEELNTASRGADAALTSRPSVRFMAIGVIVLTVGTPVAAMAAAHHRAFDVVFIWRQSGELVLGSIFMAVLAGASSIVLVVGGLRRRPFARLAVALASFLAGGQLLAIALIRLYNRPHLGWIYNAPPIIVMAYLGRFGWMPLLAAGATWSLPWKRLREQAAVDGANATQAVGSVVVPLAWPLVAASALLVTVLSMTEVPATVLAAPFRPQQMIPMLMTWVHTLESDPMIESSLLMACCVGVLSTLATALLWLAARAVRGNRLQTLATVALLASAAGLLAGCRDPAQPDAMWLSTGTAPGQVVYPRAICYDRADDSFFIVDRVARVQHLDHQGKCLNAWQMPEWQYGKPVGITVGPDGNVYIPDTHYHRVMVYSPAGQLLRKWGSEGRLNGQFIYPTDIAFDEAGHVFVSEYGDHDRIQVFDSTGTYLYEFGSFGNGDGQFSRPQSMVIDQGLVYVTDACNHRLVVFRTDGSFVRNMGGVGSELGQFRFPYGLDMDADGKLLVAEFGNNRVQRVDKQTGKGLAVWGKAGREPGELAYPWAVAIDRKQRVVTVDSGNNRLQVFSF